MRNTLLTTTALVLSAGIASADGHASITWSGAATAGVARIGKIDLAAGNLTDAQINMIDKEAGIVANIDATTSANGFESAGGMTTNYTDPAFASSGAGTAAEIAAFRKTNKAAIKVSAAEATLAAGVVTALKAEIAEIDAWIARNYSNAAADIVKVMDILTGTALADGGAVAGGYVIANTDATTTNTVGEVSAILATRRLGLLEVIRESGVSAGTAAAVAGKFKTYSEVNATVTGTVAADNGMTLTASMSVDAGEGYDFASDDGFDAAKTNGVSLDNITIGTSIGTFKIDQNAVAHLVDGDDDSNADILYTNKLGSASISAAVDVSEDKDPVYVAASTVVGVGGTTAVANDVQWSAKVSMPVSGGTAYVAMDEEGGNVFGASTTLGGVGLSFSSKLEAHEEEQKKDRSNSLGLTYVLGSTTLGATWNSVEDGDQWGISAAYAADGMTLSASTDEGSDWSVSGSMALGGGAKVVGGVNYTEDAYLGLSFSF